MPEDIKSSTSGDVSALIADLFDRSAVRPDLWVPSQSLGRISIGELCIYTLASGPENENVADWTLHYSAARSGLESQLSTFIRQSADNIDRMGSSLADILTAQGILANPVVDSDEMADITERLARDTFMGFDNLIVLSGLLTKRDLSMILSGLKPTPLLTATSKENIKMDARKVDNQLLQDVNTTETDAVSEFKETLQRARQSDEIQEYAADIWGAKIFLKKDDEKRVAMVRRLEVSNFAAWLKAYEAHDVWKALGFSHLPVEPVLDFDLKQGTADVRTMPLRSQGFREAEQNLGPDKAKSLNLQKQRIKHGLDRIGVIHGHLHSDNFQVVDSADGPRVYVIDFDKAYIKKYIR
jgi:hypothetical protein